MERTTKKSTGRLFRRADWIALCAIVICCAAVFAWAGLAFLPGTADIFRREIVNDDYDAATAPLEDNDEFLQTIYVKGRLYGFRLPLTTFEAKARGLIELTLFDSGKSAVAHSTADLSDVTDNFFRLFLFDEAIDAGEGGFYTLALSAKVESGAVALLKSEGRTAYKPENKDYDLSSFLLTENGEPQEGMLALQYITRYSGTFLYMPFIIFSILLTVYLLFLYLALFVLRMQMHRIFVVSSLTLGLLFLFVIPFRTAPDEYTHIATAYSHSNALLGVADASNGVTVRPGDKMYLANYDFGATDIFAYQEVYEGLFDPTEPGETSVIRARKAQSAFPLAYFPQVLGILFARLIGAGKMGLLFFGRFFNLVFYSLTVAYAIKTMPFAKPMMAVIALLPMCMQLAASFSYDAYVISLCFLFTALVLRGAFGEQKMKAISVAAIAAVALLTAPAKSVYLPVLLLLFLIPASKISKKAGAAVRLSVIAAAVLLWSFFNFGIVKESVGLLKTPAPSVGAAALAEHTSGQTETDTGFDAEPPVKREAVSTASPTAELTYEVRKNNEAHQRFTLGYILRHIPQTLLLVARSFYEQTPLWLQGLIGGRLGEIIAVEIEVNWLFVIGLLLILLAASLADDTDDFILGKGERRFTLAVSLLVFALFFIGCVTWTPINYDTVFGVQGRYFLPVLPLALIAFRGSNLRFKKSVSAPLVFSAVILTLLSALQAFLVIIQR